MVPETGRWLTPDPPVKAPDGKFLAAPWGLHPYQYVGQNPVLFWDPDGRDRTFAPDPSQESHYGLTALANGVKPYYNPPKSRSTARGRGVEKIVWGLAELAGAAASCAAPAPGGRVACGYLAYKAADHITTGARQIYSGEDEKSGTWHVARAVGFSDRAARHFETATDLFEVVVGGYAGYKSAGIRQIQRGPGPESIDDWVRLDRRARGGGSRNLVQDILNIKRQKGLGDIAAGTRAEASTLGKAWVNGKDVKRFDLANGGHGLTDGTRTFRLQYKPKDGVWKANFQENTFIPGRAKGIEVKNVHMTITDMSAP